MEFQNKEQAKEDKPKKSNKIAKLFLASLGITFVIFILVAASGVFAYQEIIYTPPTQGDIIVTEEIPIEMEGTEEDEINKTIMFLGTDAAGSLTDTIMVLNYNSETDKAKIVSIPRDTRVEWTTAMQTAMKEVRGYSMSVTKLNEMASYVGLDNIRDFTVKQVELMLGIKVDNYVVISLSTFKDIVDAIGGVEMYVPSNMYYVDNYQGLYINLKEGLQVLDGEKAEMLVRYRQYSNGDVDRVAVQQLFVEALIETVLSPSIFTKIPDLLSVVFSSVRTDASLIEALSYLEYTKGFNTEALEFYTIPGEGKYVGDVSYFIADMDAMPAFVEEVFFDKVPASTTYNTSFNTDTTITQNHEEETTTNDTVIINKSVSIEVLNGGRTNGAASMERAVLQSAGYSVYRVGDYTPGLIARPQINVRKIEYGAQFLEFYPDGQINVDTTLDYDVQLIIL